MMSMRQIAMALALFVLPFSAERATTAESFTPNKPIKIIVPFPVGGSTDVGARVVAAYLSRSLGQQVFVENRSGANGTVGVEDAAKSAPDGYTLLVTIDAVASNPHVFKTNINPTKDLSPIVQLSRQPIVMAVHPSLGVNSVAELVSLAKQQPGLRYATGSGLGSPQHMAMQWFAQIADIRLEQVPYRGGGQAITDLIGGYVKLGSLGSTPLIPHYRAGTLRLLAQTTAKRSESLPDVPTFEESGIAGLVLDQWLGVFAPGGTPPAIVARYNTELNNALVDPAVRKSFMDSAQEPVGGSTDQFAQFVSAEYAKFERLAKQLNIKID